MWVFTKAFDNCVVRVILAMVLIYCIMASHWLIFVVCAIFAGSMLLYDAYRKEQKELEQTEATAPEQEKPNNPLDDFDKL